MKTFTTSTRSRTDCAQLQIGLADCRSAFLSIGTFAVFAIIAYLIWLKISFDPTVQRQGGKIKPEQRLPPAIYCVWLQPICLVTFGWLSRPSISYWGPLIVSGLFAPASYNLFQAALGYLTDAYPDHIAAVFASNAFARSCFGAGAPLFANAFYTHLGIGWANTLLAFVSLALCPTPYILYRCASTPALITDLARRPCDPQTLEMGFSRRLNDSCTPHRCTSSCIDNVTPGLRSRGVVRGSSSTRVCAFAVQRAAAGAHCAATMDCVLDSSAIRRASPSCARLTFAAFTKAIGTLAKFGDDLEIDASPDAVRSDVIERAEPSAPPVCYVTSTLSIRSRVIPDRVLPSIPHPAVRRGSQGAVDQDPARCQGTHSYKSL